MSSLILQIAARYVRTLFYIFAWLALIRGHNYPGGGFIGGLIAALPMIYAYFAFGRSVALKKILLRPEVMIFTGLLIVLCSTIPGMLAGGPVMKGIWWEIPAGITALKLGTPFLFDVGVFFTVIGVTQLFVVSLLKDD